MSTRWVLSYSGTPPVVAFSGTEGQGTPIVVDTLTDTPYYLKGNVVTPFAGGGGGISDTAAGSGGTRIAMTGDNLQMETSEPNSQVNDLGIATTGALTAGTKTLDANAFGQCLGGVGTAAVTAYAGNTTLIAPQPLLDATAGQPALVLANQEGFVIRTTHAGPAGLTYVAGFTIVWREVTAY